MSMTTRHRSNPVAELLKWLEEPGTAPRGLGLLPEIRVEDFVQEGSYTLRAEIPGVDPETDLDVRVAGDHLIVQGSRKEEERSKNRHELHYGTFYRSVRLPEGADADAATATYHDGVLEVTVPVNAEAAATRHVPVVRAEG